MVLILAAVGAGFVVAVLFQGPAAADDGVAGERHHRTGVIERVVRLTVGDGIDRHRQRDAGADDPHRDLPPASPAAAVRHAPATPRLSPERVGRGAARSVVLPRVASSATHRPVERGTLRPGLRSESTVRVGHLPPRDAGPPRRVVTPPAPIVAAPVDAVSLPRAHPRLAAPPVVRPVISSTVGLVAASVAQVVGVVDRVPIRPVIVALGRVTDVILSPVLGAVIVPAPARLPALAGPGLRQVPVTDAASRPAPAPPVDPALAPVRPVELLPAVAAPWQVSVVHGPRLTSAAGRPVARPGRSSTPAGLPGLPVTPADQDAAGVYDGSTPAPGLVWPVVRQVPAAAAQTFDLGLFVLGTRSPSVIARPG